MNKRTADRLQTLQARVIAGDKARAERDRYVARIHEGDGYTQTEIAKVLGISRNSVQKVIDRQRRHEGNGQ